MVGIEGNAPSSSQCQCDILLLYHIPIKNLVAERGIAPTLQTL